MELSTIEAATTLGISDDTIRRACDTGELPHRRQGLRRIIRIQVADLRAYAARMHYTINEDYLTTLQATEK